MGALSGQDQLDLAAARKNARVDLFWDVIRHSGSDPYYDEAISRVAELACGLPHHTIAWVKQGEKFGTIELYLWDNFTGDSVNPKVKAINELGFNEWKRPPDSRDADWIVTLRPRRGLG